VWAPCLTYADGLFWLVYTDVKRYGRTSSGGATGGASLRDFHNYLVTSPTIDGPWSDPVYLNSSGFDPSLFHDDDGRKYVLNQPVGPSSRQHALCRHRVAGICRWQADRQAREYLKGTPHGLTEAPHLYKRNGYYYLLTAEGGTGWNHGVTMARSRNLHGPYELHPDQTILSARHRPDAQLQRAGHADLVETPDGQTYAVYLCGRPLRNRGTCTLGRETAIQPMVWGEDGWLRTRDGAGTPELQAAAPGCPSIASRRRRCARIRCAAAAADFQRLRHAVAGRVVQPDRAARPSAPVWSRNDGQPVPSGAGGAPPASALLQRVHGGRVRAGALPAGLVCYYGGAKFHYLYITHDDDVGKHLRVMSSFPNHVQADAFTAPIALPSGVPVQLRVEVDEERLYFGYRVDGGAWQWLPQQFDASILSDEANAPGQPNFTGAPCRHGMPGYGRHRTARRLRLFRVPRTALRHQSEDGGLGDCFLSCSFCFCLRRMAVSAAIRFTWRLWWPCLASLHGASMLE
jgi:xylan 1,4-beta-xylosidase